MTSSLPRKSRRAFTLIELLVVVGIIVLLATIALPMMSRAMSQAKRTQMAADLQSISQALEAYRADFGDYPRRRSTDANGASLLCWALIAPGPASLTNGIPGDGADGPGFRLRGTTGTVKGPYLAPDRFTIGVLGQMGSSPLTVATPTGGVFDNRATVIADRYLHPILYFPANTSADPHGTGVSSGSFVNSSPTASSQAVFNYADMYSDQFPQGMGIGVTPNVLTAKVMAYRLGNINGTGTLSATDQPVATGPYLLWSPGPDGYYGNDGTHGSACDDVVNNGGSVQLNTSLLPANMP
jgi:prepilin-type N-terminal cleavage/methylation domain-containing protein